MGIHWITKNKTSFNHKTEPGLCGSKMRKVSEKGRTHMWSNVLQCCCSAVAVLLQCIAVSDSIVLQRKEIAWVGYPKDTFVTIHGGNTLELPRPWDAWINSRRVWKERPWDAWGLSTLHASERRHTNLPGRIQLKMSTMTYVVHVCVCACAYILV